MKKSLISLLSMLAFSNAYSMNAEQYNNVGQAGSTDNSAVSQYSNADQYQATLAAGEELRALQAQIQALESKIKQLEGAYQKSEATQKKIIAEQEKQEKVVASLPKAAPIAETVTVESEGGKPAKKFWRLFDTGTQMSISGFVKLTGIKDFSGGTRAFEGDGAAAGRYYLAARNNALKDDGTPPARSFNLHGRESRFTLETISPLNGTDLRTCLEMDFLGDGGGNDIVANGYNVRLRKAYAKLHGFTIGQDCSTFCDMTTFPELVDMNGPVGNCQIRQTQIRYSKEFGKDFLVDVAIENPESEVVAPDGTAISSSSSKASAPYTKNLRAEKRLPDFVAAVKYKQDWGHVRLAGAVRENSVRIKNDDGSTTTKNKMGYLFDLTGMLKAFGNDAIVGQIGYGAGAGRYFTETMKYATYLDANKKLHNEKAFHASIGYKHQWMEKYNLRSTIALGYIKMKHSSAFKEFIHAAVADPAADATAAEISAINTLKDTKNNINKSLFSFHANLKADITKNTQVGIEYIMAKRKTELGKSGTLRRIAFAVQVNF